MDAFQGCLKDGTDGTRDCRRFIAVYFGTGYILYFLFAFIPIAYLLPLGAIVHIIVSILHNTIRPYKLAYYNFIAAGMFLLMAIYCILALAIVTISTQAPGYITSAVVLFAKLGTIPQLYITGVVIYWLVHKKIFSSIRMPNLLIHNIANSTHITSHNWLSRKNSYTCMQLQLAKGL